jgi:hypothetical protein
MKRLFFLAWWALAVSSFAVGYGLATPWYWEFGVLASALVWLLAGELPGLGLGLSILVAALGLLLSAPEAPMILGASASLGLWDFARASLAFARSNAFARSGPASASSSAAIEDYRRSRLPLLLLAVGLGTLAAVLGPALTLSLPFYVMALCVLVCAFSIDRMVRLISRYAARASSRR